MNAMWKCPACRRPFANRNQEHSCGRFSVEDFLKGKNPEAVVLYRQLEQMILSLGPVMLAPAKTRVGFQARMIFAAVSRLAGSGLTGHVVLARKLENPRFIKIESISLRNHVHHFHIRKSAELDTEVQSWLEEAYKVGLQEHLPWRVNKTP